ncbi:MAG: DUF1257 domain-containing protein [Armatimonadota bacterium]
MSHYVRCNTVFRDRESLVHALTELGWSREQIEDHEEATPLYGYQGDLRLETAHVIIRRRHIGGLSNDLGFARQEDGTYAAIISEYDRDSLGYDAAWLGRLRQSYAAEQIRKQCAQRRIPLQREVKDGRIILRLQPVRR